MSSLLDYCQNDAERKVIKAYEAYGSNRKAALAIGCGKTHVGDVRRRVLERSNQEDFYSAPDGYLVKGVSKLIDAETGAEKLKWIKTSVDEVRRYEHWQEAAQGLIASLPQAEASPTPSQSSQDLLVGYPVGDQHIGMLAWGDETGVSHDTARSEALLKGAMDHLLNTTVNAEQCLIALLGDFMHYDNLESVTPKHKNQLDTDTRYANVVRVAMRTVRYLIESALKKHSQVTVICEIGNHDPASMIFLTEALDHIYQYEPRVIIDRSPSKFHYFRFGNVLIGTHHGDTVKKLDSLPLVMAADQPENWGETNHRYWWTGHVHHQSVKEFPGCLVESFRILPPLDAYAHGGGYRSLSDMKAITYHRKYGEIARSVFTPAMLK